MSSLNKMLGIMELFTDAKFAWTAEEMEARLGITRSTLYRYLRELVDAEFLTSLPQLGYTLGPKIIELESLVQRQDPLISASRPLLAELVGEFGGLTALCRLYRQRVMCVHQEQGVDGFQSGYHKGQARPLLAGSASRVILAHLPGPLVRRLYDEHAPAFHRNGLGETLEAVRQSLRTIRQRGWDVTIGHVTPGVTGIAAPIFDGRQKVLGSLSAVVRRTGLSEERLAAMADKTSFCARSITRALSHADGGEVAPNVRRGRALSRLNSIM